MAASPGLRPSATTHWRAAQLLADLYPEVDVDPKVLFVDNGQVLTSAGATAGTDLCLHMVERDYGAFVAAQAAKAAVAPLQRSGGQAQYIEYLPLGSAGDSFNLLLEWIQDNLSEPITVDLLGELVATSPRTLHRKFLSQVGMTPARWVTRARVRKAQVLLETTDQSMPFCPAGTFSGSR